MFDYFYNLLYAIRLSEHKMEKREKKDNGSLIIIFIICTRLGKMNDEEQVEMRGNLYGYSVRNCECKNG